MYAEMGIPLFASLLLLQLLACASCNNCPPPEDIYPCKCETSRSFRGHVVLDCMKVSLKETKAALDQFRGKSTIIDRVMIYEAKGDRLPSSLFRNTHTRSIVIQNCDIPDLLDSDGKPAFLGLENTLEMLQVTSSIKGKNSLKTLDLSYLKRLYHLVLTDQNIPEVGNDWFAKGPFNLKVLLIESSGLSKIGETAFATLAKLESLDLAGNQIFAFERTMIPYSDCRVRFLSLGNNNLTKLPEDIFTEMPSLETIYLGGNSIKRIEEKTWASVWGSIYSFNSFQIYLNDNPLECDSHMEWLFSLWQPSVLVGTCDSPESVKGVLLKEFISSNEFMHKTK